MVHYASSSALFTHFTRLKNFGTQKYLVPPAGKERSMMWAQISISLSCCVLCVSRLPGYRGAGTQKFCVLVVSSSGMVDVPTASIKDARVAQSRRSPGGWHAEMACGMSAWCCANFPWSCWVLLLHHPVCHSWASLLSRASEAKINKYRVFFSKTTPGHST